MKALHERMSKDRHKFHEDFESYMNSVDTFLEENETPAGYVGSCCIISQHVEEEVRLEEMKNETNISDHFSSVAGGTFCLPEFNLLIGSNTTSIDVFGLGEETDTKGFWHSVLDEQHCRNIERSASKKVNRTIPDSWYHEIITCPAIDEPHKLCFKKKKVRYLCI